MRAYIIRRILLIIPTLLLVTAIIFFSIRLIPGDVVDLMATQQEFTTGWGVEEIRHELGLDVPIHIQYGRWLSNIILHGDFGKSLWSQRPVLEEILPRFPVSIELGILSILIALLIALPIGVYSGVRQDTPGDYIGRSFAITCIAIPSFWTGTMIVVFSAIWWGWSPSMLMIPFFENPIENLKMFIVPAFVLGMVLSGITMRMTRTMVLEVLRQDYIRTAWAKGLQERVIILRHVLKNALIPVVTVVGVQFPILIGGAIVTEQIFNLPGIGRLLVKVLNTRDYTVLSGINIIMASLVLLVNLVVDLTYGYLDPRIHYK